jgi:hypothetical protein
VKIYENKNKIQKNTADFLKNEKNMNLDEFLLDRLISTSRGSISGNSAQLKKGAIF